MATSTTNLGLIKPAGSDKIRIAQINQNSDLIDAAIGPVGSTNLQAQANALKNGMAIVSNNNTHAAITAGQYVYVYGHGTLSEGLYIATANIGANGSLSGSNVSPVSGGGLNALNDNISNVNSKVDAQKTIFVQLFDQTIAGSSSSAETTTFDLSNYIPSGYSLWSVEIQIRDGSSFYNIPWFNNALTQYTAIGKVTNASVTINNKADWSGNRSVTFTLHCKKN